MERTFVVSSTKSTITSLKKISEGRAGLNNHRLSLYNKVPNSGDWAKVKKGSVSNKDVAYLSAFTNHEFAVLSGKNEDIIFHGTHRHCEFKGVLFDLLEERKLELLVHSHLDKGKLTPSLDDKNLLTMIGQKESIIVSAIDASEVIFYNNDIFQIF